MAGAFLSETDLMRMALRLAKKGQGLTTPNPMVGAVVSRAGLVIGSGWHQQAGAPHAEIEALRDVQSRGESPRGAVLHVTLEPCCTHGRTPPCTTAIIASGIKKVRVAATDPNPLHAGRAFQILQTAGIEVITGVLADQATQMNEVFNHWIVHRQPFVTLKAAMTLDGRIATATGQSKWITGPQARLESMKLRRVQDAILVGVETVLRDDPSLTRRQPLGSKFPLPKKPLRRIILDSQARTPLTSKIVTDDLSAATTIYATVAAPRRRVESLRGRVRVEIAPATRGKVDLQYLLSQLGKEEITSLLVEGGGEVHASFLEAGEAQRVVFFFAPLILGGKNSKRATAGEGIPSLALAPKLDQIQWKRLGPDLMVRARVRRTGSDTFRKPA